MIQKCRAVTLCLVPAFMITIFLLNSIPSAFIPQEDQNVLFGMSQLAAGASLPATAKVAEEAASILKQEQQSKDSAFDDAVVIAGYGDPSSLTFFVSLKDLEDRPEKTQGADSQARSLAAKLFTLPTSTPMFFVQPPMIPVAADSSIDMLLLDKSSKAYTLEELNEIAQRFKESVQKDPSVSNINTTFAPDAPAYELTIDRSKLSSLGVDFNTATSTLAQLAGSTRVNQTSVPGGLKDVQLISESKGRRTINDLLDYSVRSTNGNMIKVRQFTDAVLTSAPPLFPELTAASV